MHKLGALGSIEQMLEERMAAVNSSALSTYRICICSNSRTFTRSSSASAHRRRCGTDCMYNCIALCVPRRVFCVCLAAMGAALIYFLQK